MRKHEQYRDESFAGDSYEEEDGENFCEEIDDNDDGNPNDTNHYRNDNPNDDGNPNDRKEMRGYEEKMYTDDRRKDSRHREEILSSPRANLCSRFSDDEQLPPTKRNGRQLQNGGHRPGQQNRGGQDTEALLVSIS